MTERGGDTSTFQENSLRLAAMSVLEQLPADDSYRQLRSIGKEQADFSPLASHLRYSYPEEGQRFFFTYAFGPEGANFPNGEELGKFLAEINSIRWFEPAEEPDIVTIETNVDGHFKALNIERLPLKVIRDDWAMAQKAQRDSVITTARADAEIATRGETYFGDRAAAKNAAWDIVRVANEQVITRSAESSASQPQQAAVRAASGDAGLAAEWIVAEELMPGRGYRNGNPFTSLIEMYKMGAWPIGIVEEKKGLLRRKNLEFVVFIPEVAPETPKAA